MQIYNPCLTRLQRRADGLGRRLASDGTVVLPRDAGKGGPPDDDGAGKERGYFGKVTAHRGWRGAEMMGTGHLYTKVGGMSACASSNVGPRAWRARPRSYCDFMLLLSAETAWTLFRTPPHKFDALCCLSGISRMAPLRAPVTCRVTCPLCCRVGILLELRVGALPGAAAPTPPDPRELTAPRTAPHPPRFPPGFAAAMFRRPPACARASSFMLARPPAPGAVGFRFSFFFGDVGTSSVPPVPRLAEPPIVVEGDPSSAATSISTAKRTAPRVGRVASSPAAGGVAAPSPPAGPVAAVSRPQPTV